MGLLFFSCVAVIRLLGANVLNCVLGGRLKIRLIFIGDIEKRERDF